MREALAINNDQHKELADQKFALDQHAIVAVTDVQGTITYVNEKFCAISQYSEGELIGQNHRILNSGHHSREFFEQMYRTIANGKVWHGEIRNRAKDGSIYWVATTVVPFVGEDGKPRQYVAIRADITERKCAEQALEETLARNEAALKDLADQKFALDQHAIVATTDVQGNITYVNDKFCAISQYSREELVGQNHRILSSGHHPTEFFRKLYQTIANGQVWRGEICNRAKDKSLYWVATTIVPFLGVDGKPRQYMAIRSDVTERKRAEEAHARLAAAVESSDDAIFCKTPDGTITAWNAGAEKMFGYVASETVGKPMLMLMPPECVDEESDILARIRNGESVKLFETLRVRKDGHKIIVSATVSPIRDSGGAIVGASTIARDVTERKRAEETLREKEHLLAESQTKLQSEARYRGLLEAAPDAMVISDAKGRIILVNAETERLFNYNRDELIGRPVEILVPERFRDRHPEQRQGYTVHPHTRTMDDGLELRGLRKDGSEFPVEISLSPLETPEGVLVTAAIRDISVRKEAETHLVKTVGELKRSNDELQQFAYVSSHDLQEPLRMVTSYTQLLAKRYKGRLDSDADEFISFAVDGCNRMQGLIQDLLAYSRAGTNGKALCEVPADDALQGALTNLRITIEQSGAVVSHDSLPVIRTDETQLIQVLQNLIGNAIKYRSAEVPRVHVGATKNGSSEWIFSVRDNGMGIDPQYFDRIFILFQRLHGRNEFEGTGIGLAICKKVLERLGGRIWVESQPGKGTTFYFALPERAEKS